MRMRSPFLRCFVIMVTSSSIIELTCFFGSSFDSASAVARWRSVTVLTDGAALAAALGFSAIVFSWFGWEFRLKKR